MKPCPCRKLSSHRPGQRTTDVSHLFTCNEKSNLLSPLLVYSCRFSHLIGCCHQKICQHWWKFRYVQQIDVAPVCSLNVVLPGVTLYSSIVLNTALLAAATLIRNLYNGAALLSKYFLKNKRLNKAFIFRRKWRKSLRYPYRD